MCPVCWNNNLDEWNETPVVYCWNNNLDDVVDLPTESTRDLGHDYEVDMGPKRDQDLYQWKLQLIILSPVCWYLYWYPTSFSHKLNFSHQL